MTSCIGRMGGRGDDWFAMLDFDGGEATVVRRGRGGVVVGPIATVPLGGVHPADDDYEAELVDDEQNRNLLMIVFAPEVARACRGIGARAERMAADIEAASDRADDSGRLLSAARIFIEGVAREMRAIGDTQRVPEPVNPTHAAENAGGER